MSDRAKRIAAESQLLAEERWLINAIQRIRKQRNCLQIERLQLESMISEAKTGVIAKNNVTDAIVENTLPSTSNPATPKESEPVVLEITHDSVTDDNLCNFQELNLNVTNPNTFTQHQTEEEEEEDDDDDDDQEDMMVDINILMNIN